MSFQSAKKIQSNLDSGLCVAFLCQDVAHSTQNPKIWNQKMKKTLNFYWLCSLAIVKT